MKVSSKRIESEYFTEIPVRYCAPLIFSQTQNQRPFPTELSFDASLKSIREICGTHESSPPFGYLSSTQAPGHRHFGNQSFPEARNDSHAEWKPKACVRNLLRRVRAFCLSAHTTTSSQINNGKLFHYQLESPSHATNQRFPPHAGKVLAVPFLVRQADLSSDSIAKSGTGQSRIASLPITNTEAMNFELYSRVQAICKSKAHPSAPFPAELVKHVRNDAVSSALVRLVDTLFRELRLGWDEEVLKPKKNGQTPSADAMPSTATSQAIVLFRFLPKYPEIVQPFHHAHRMFQQNSANSSRACLVPETPYYLQRLGGVPDSAHCAVQKMHYLLESYVGIVCANPPKDLMRHGETQFVLHPELMSVFGRLLDIFIVRVRESASSHIYRFEILRTQSADLQKGVCSKKTEVATCILEKIHQATTRKNALVVFVQPTWYELVARHKDDSDSMYVLLCALGKSVAESHFFKSKAIACNSGAACTTLHCPLAEAWRMLKRLCGAERLFEEFLIHTAVQQDMEANGNVRGDVKRFQEPTLTCISSDPRASHQRTKALSSKSTTFVQGDIPADNMWCETLVSMNANWRDRCKDMAMYPDSFSSSVLASIKRVSCWDYLAYSARRRSVLRDNIFRSYTRRIAVCLPVATATGPATYTIAEISLKPPSSHGVSEYSAQTLLSNAYFWKNNYCCENPEAFREANRSYADRITIRSKKNINTVDLQAFDVLVFHRFGLPIADPESALKASRIPNDIFLEFIQNGGRIWCTLFGSQLLSGHISSLPLEHETLLRESTGICEDFHDSGSLNYFILALAQIYNHQLVSALVGGTLPSITNMMKSLYISHIFTRTGIGN